MNFESMTNKAIAQELGQRIEQMRLEQNITQQQLADEIGLTRLSYQRLVNGLGKFENIIAILRVLGKLELAENFIPETTFSPMAQLELEGKKRQRARASSEVKKDDKADDLDW